MNSNNGALSAVDTGVAVNGNANDSSINNNQNNVNTGDNTNVNVITPTLVAPNQSASASSGGVGVGGTGGLGGNAVLMMPRNPLPLSNAAAGRSNFGVQFGLQNNPILGSLGGRQNGLGWFLQTGITVPFGKIPDVFRNGQNSPLDTARQDTLERQRNVLGQMNPSEKEGAGEKKVQGKITGISAYNYSALPSGKLSMPSLSMPSLLDQVGEVQDSKFSQPKLVALSSAQVFSKPLNTGEKIGEVQVGYEYPYLGHTRSGWVKILLQNGTTGWTSTRFEYLKQDFTEIDDLAAAPVVSPKGHTASAGTRPTHSFVGKQRG